MIFTLLLAGFKAIISVLRFLMPFQSKEYYDIYQRKYDKR